MDAERLHLHGLLPVPQWRSNGFETMGMVGRMKFSQVNDPKRWSTGRSVWVGHPAIARGIVRFFAWLNRLAQGKSEVQK